VILKTIYTMEKVFRLLVAGSTLATISKARSMAKVLKSGVQAVSIKENGGEIKCMVRAIWSTMKINNAT
jgi:hypothetical protein